MHARRLTFWAATVPVLWGCSGAAQPVVDADTARVLRDTRGLTSVEYILLAALVAVVCTLAWRSLGESVADRGREAERTIAGLPAGARVTGTGTGTETGASSSAHRGDSSRSVGGSSAGLRSPSGGVGDPSGATSGSSGPVGGPSGSLGDSSGQAGGSSGLLGEPLGSLGGDMGLGGNDMGLGDLGGGSLGNRSRPRSRTSPGGSSDPRDRLARMGLDEAMAPPRSRPDSPGIRVASNDERDAFEHLAAAERRRLESESNEGSELVGPWPGVPRDEAVQPPGSWGDRFNRSVRDGFVGSARAVGDAVGEVWDYTTTPSRWNDTAAAAGGMLANDYRRVTSNPLGYLWDGVKADARIAKNVLVGVGEGMYNTGADLVSGDPERMGRALVAASVEGTVSIATAGWGLGTMAAVKGGRVAMGAERAVPHGSKASRADAATAPRAGRRPAAAPSVTLHGLDDIDRYLETPEARSTVELLWMPSRGPRSGTGHVALRVDDMIHEVERPGATSTSFREYMQEELAAGRTTHGFAFPVDEAAKGRVVQHFDDFRARGDTYNLLMNNCSLNACAALQKGGVAELNRAIATDPAIATAIINRMPGLQRRLVYTSGQGSARRYIPNNLTIRAPPVVGLATLSMMTTRSFASDEDERESESGEDSEGDRRGR